MLVIDFTFCIMNIGCLNLHIPESKAKSETVLGEWLLQSSSKYCAGSRESNKVTYHKEGEKPDRLLNSGAAQEPLFSSAVLLSC